MQSDDGSAWWVAQGPWPTGAVLRGRGLGADAHLCRAAGLLERAEPIQWRAAAARAFVDRLAELATEIHRLTDEVAAAELEVAALEAELAAARAALHPGPWWTAATTDRAGRLGWVGNA